MATVYTHLNDWFFCEYTSRKKGWRMENMHYHPTHELFIMMKGQTSLISENNIIELKKGDVALFKKNKLHKNNGGSDHGRYALNFSDKYLASFFTETAAGELMKCFSYQKIHIPSQKLGYAAVLLRRICEGECEYAYLAVLLSLLNDIAETKQSAASEAENEKKEDIVKILNFIKNNYSSINSVDDVANAAHISKSYLCQKFKRETDMTVTEYINSVRIKNACAFLADKGLNVSETALRCGYSTSSYFCKVFKSIVNMTPHEYKNYVETMRQA